MEEPLPVYRKPKGHGWSFACASFVRDQGVPNSKEALVFNVALVPHKKSEAQYS